MTRDETPVGRTGDWQPSAPAFIAWVQDAVGRGSRVVRVSEMPTSSTQKHAIDVALSDGGNLRLVLRRYHDVERLVSDPWYVAKNEARALELLDATVVPAPRLLATDLEAEICDVPALLETWVPGEQAWQPSDLNVYVKEAAATLVAIHAVATPTAEDLPAYSPYLADEDPIRELVPSWSARRTMWERVFARIEGKWPLTPTRFIHRDYHPGNALWDGQRVSGVVDWATAARGPAGIDLARMRQNLASWHGTEVADSFANCYIEVGGDPAARDPFWDLLDAADSAAYFDEPGAPGGGDVGRFEAYAASVLAEL